MSIPYRDVWPNQVTPPGPFVMLNPLATLADMAGLAELRHAAGQSIADDLAAIRRYAREQAARAEGMRRAGEVMEEVR